MGGNVTGSTFFDSELMAKRLEVLKEILPSMTRAGVLVVRNHPSVRGMLEAMASAAQELNVAIQPIEVGEPGEFDNALSAWAATQARGFVMQDHGSCWPIRIRSPRSPSGIDCFRLGRSNCRQAAACSVTE